MNKLISILFAFTFVSGLQALQNLKFSKIRNGNHLNNYFMSLEKLSDSNSKQVPKSQGKIENQDFLRNLGYSLVANKLLFGLLKNAARNFFISAAEKKGVKWRSNAAELKKDQKILDDYYSQFIATNVTTHYPDYFNQQFHSYENGNLEWKAVYEVESATYVVPTRTFVNDTTSSVEKLQDIWRSRFINDIKKYRSEYCGNKKSTPRIIDIGCSAGLNTFYLAQAFPESKLIQGLDLSPYFLSLALLRQNQILNKVPVRADDQVAIYLKDRFSDAKVSKIKWIYENAENTKLPSKSLDLVMASFIFHELPQTAAKVIINEMFRICAPNGIAVITDTDPDSAFIRALPAFVMTFQRATEPWTKEYCDMDTKEVLRQAGFVDVISVATDPKHVTILARRP